MIYFTADEHYGHDAVRAYYARPFGNIEIMDKELIKQHNSRVKDGDLVIHVGDFFDPTQAEPGRRAEYYKKQLTGRHIYINGDHNEVGEILIEEMVITIGKRVMLLRHIPESNINLDYGLCIVGHVHTKWEVDLRGECVLINAGVDVWDFRPATLDEMLIRGRVT